MPPHGISRGRKRKNDDLGLLRRKTKTKKKTTTSVMGAKEEVKRKTSA